MRSGLKRNPIDKYYTNENVVQFCYDLIKQTLKIQKSDVIVEPSAGNGAWIPTIKQLSNNHRFYDIKPEHPDIIKQNFLTLKENLSDSYLIGNPPFGRKSSTAIKFIKHAAFLKAKVIAFILPNSFKKQSFRKSFPLNYHLVLQKNIPEYGFIYDNKPYNVPSVFQIWERRDYDRKQTTKLYPKAWYKFVKKEDCDISIKRVGFGIGKVKKCSIDDNVNSHWFIKLFKDVDIAALNKIKFNRTQNVGALSISKQDIIRKYNKL